MPCYPAFMTDRQTVTACLSQHDTPAAMAFYARAFGAERAGRLRDPYGHVWIVSQLIEPLTEAEMQAWLDAMGG